MQRQKTGIGYGSGWRNTKQVGKIAFCLIFPLNMVFVLPAHAVHFDYSNTAYSQYQLIDSELFGANGHFNIYEHKQSFDLNVGDSDLGFAAFVGGIVQPSEGSGSGVFTLSGPMTINGISYAFNFDVAYTFQTTPFQPSTFHFVNLPSLTYDFGSDGVLVGTWLNDEVQCGATGGCGGGVFPGVSFTLQAPSSVPEPSTVLLLGLGVVGLGLLSKRNKTP